MNLLENSLKVQNVRDAKKTAATVQEIQVSLMKLVENTQHQSAVSSSSTVVLELPPLIVGLDAPLKKLKVKLLADHGVSMLVLTAPGGCGKTTLATMFCQDQEVKGKFKKNTIFFTVSQKGNMDSIVKQLYEQRACPVPTLQNEVHKVQWLHTFLKKEGRQQLLLVLDDVWSRSEHLLDKFDQLKMPKFKILVTSRSEFSRFASYSLELLDDDTAMELFNHTTFLGDKSSRIPVDLARQITNLYELRSRRLANLVDGRRVTIQEDRDYSRHYVTQHDLLGELAIYHSKLDKIEHRKRVVIDICGNNLPKWWTEQKCQPMQACLLSISTDDKFSIKWPNMQLPEAEVLMLNFQRWEDYALPEFVVTNLGISHDNARISNFRLLTSLSNLKRVRLDGISIPYVLSYPVQLRSLRKLFLFNCHIGRAFSNSRFISNVFPILQELDVDSCQNNDSEGLPLELCELTHLEKLSINNCPQLSALPERLGDLVNLVVLRLRLCGDLLMLPTSVRTLKQLEILDISDNIKIEELPEYIGELSNLKKLITVNCPCKYSLPPSILKLEQLEQVICDSLSKALWTPFLAFLDLQNIRMVLVPDSCLHIRTNHSDRKPLYEARNKREEWLKGFHHQYL